MSIIEQIEAQTDYDELQKLAVRLLSQEVSDEVLNAIEKRQDELYIPTKKDIAETKLRKILSKPATPHRMQKAAKLMEVVRG